MTFLLMKTLFGDELSQIDGEGKISIIEEDFHQSKVAIENDNYERNFSKRAVFSRLGFFL